MSSRKPLGIALRIYYRPWILFIKICNGCVGWLWLTWLWLWERSTRRRFQRRAPSCSTPSQSPISQYLSALQVRYVISFSTHFFFLKIMPVCWVFFHFEVVTYPFFAVLIPDINVVLGLIGGSVAVFVMFILPGAHDISVAWATVLWLHCSSNISMIFFRLFVGQAPWLWGWGRIQYATRRICRCASSTFGSNKNILEEKSEHIRFSWYDRFFVFLIDTCSKFSFYRGVGYMTIVAGGIVLVLSVGISLYNDISHVLSASPPAGC